jgi:hypothetical protein
MKLFKKTLVLMIGKYKLRKYLQWKERKLQKMKKRYFGAITTHIHTQRILLSDTYKDTKEI